MKPRVSTRFVARLFFLAIFPILFAGCGTFQLPTMEVGSRWVAEGKTQEELRADQAECRRDVMVVRPPSLAGPGGMEGSGWDRGDLKQFDNCMRAKGWKKE